MDSDPTPDQGAGSRPPAGSRRQPGQARGIPGPGPLRRTRAETERDRGDARGGRMLTNEPEALWASWRRKRSNALAERIFDLTAPRLRLLAATLLRDPNDIDDVLQETYLSAFGNAEEFRAGQDLLPWLGGILRNKIRMRRRTEARLTQRETARGLAPSHQPEDPLESAELLDALTRGIAGLPSAYRPVVARRVFDDAPFRTIARDLDRNENTVRVQCGRGLRMLREALPAGLATALAVALLPGRGAAMLRQQVLDQLPGPPPPGPPEPAPAVDGTTPGPGAATDRMGRLLQARRLAALALGLAAVVIPLGLLASSDAAGTPAAGATAPDPSDPAAAHSRTADAGIPDRTPVAATVDAAAAATGELTVSVTLDGLPAANVPLSLETLDPTRLFLRHADDAWGTRSVPAHRVPDDALRTLTGPDGRATLALTAAHSLLRAPGCGALLAGTADRGIKLEVGRHAMRVRGRVTHDGAPLPGATVLVRQGPYSQSFEPLQTTSDTGLFDLVIPHGSHLHATAGHLQAGAVPLGAEPRDDLELVLSPGAVITGRVLRRDGSPADHAVVEADAGRRRTRTITDADGGFALGGLPVGEVSVRAVSVGGGGSGWHQLELAPRASRRLELQLGGTARIHGRVTTAEGAPVPHTRVRTGRHFNGLDARHTATDAEGRFVLDHVPTGAVQIEAGLGAAGVATAALTLRAGEEFRHDFVLAPSNLQVRGRFDRAADEAGLYFAIDEGQHLSPPTIVSVDAGRFATRIHPDRAGRPLTGRLYTATALSPDLRRVTGFPLAVYPGLHAGGAEQRLRLPAVLRPTAGFRATLVVPPGVGGELRLTRPDLAHWIPLARIDGSPQPRSVEVEQQSLPAGRYRLTCGPDLEPVDFVLEDGARRDLGTIAFAETADPRRQSVFLTFRQSDDGSPMERLDLSLEGPGGAPPLRCSLLGDSSSWHKQLELVPGRWRLRAKTHGGLTVDAELVVPADEPLRRQFVLRAAAVADTGDR